MDQRNFVVACPKLQESQRIDPGGGTLLNLALCHEEEGRAATAWAEFIEAFGIAKRDRRAARIQFAEEHIRALEPTLSRITLVVPAGTDEPDLELRRDGALVGRAAWGMPFPVDPGEHTVEALAPDRVPWRTTVSVGARGQAKAVTVQVPALVPATTPTMSAARAPGGVGTESGGASSPAVASASRGEGGRAEQGPPVPGHEEGASATRRGWAFASLAVGAAGIGVGSVLGVMAITKQNRSTERCPHDPCDAEAVQLSQSAGRAADWATVGFAVGLSSAAVGTYLLLTRGSAEPPSHGERSTHVEWAIRPAARNSGASLTATGRF
ncbi:MAG TPA: hypothetical protein VF395_20585 [Polyangiaceae bacterium]